jgi:ABC-type Zn uptake system ZnuABC Zn-binding protein ZnuA
VKPSEIARLEDADLVIITGKDLKCLQRIADELRRQRHSAGESRRYGVMIAEIAHTSTPVPTL